MAVVIAITVVAATSSPPPCLAFNSFYTLLYLLTVYSDTVIFCFLCEASGLVYVVPTLDKYYCVVTIGDNDPCHRHEIPHLSRLGGQKQYYSVIFSINAVTCNLG
jgi:hypothetical protein